jgi:hypothetical protein
MSRLLRIASEVKGFSIKSTAPALIARTASVSRGVGLELLF